MAQIGFLNDAAAVHAAGKLVYLTERGLRVGVIKVARSVPGQRLPQDDNVERLIMLIDAFKGERRERGVVAEFHEMDRQHRGACGHPRLQVVCNGNGGRNDGEYYFGIYAFAIDSEDPGPKAGGWTLAVPFPPA
jgi:hypothetical protein